MIKSSRLLRFRNSKKFVVGKTIEIDSQKSLYWKTNRNRPNPQKVPKSQKTSRVDPLISIFLTLLFEALWAKTSKNEDFPENLLLY